MHCLGAMCWPSKMTCIVVGVDVLKANAVFVIQSLLVSRAVSCKRRSCSKSWWPDVIPAGIYRCSSIASSDVLVLAAM